MVLQRHARHGIDKGLQRGPVSGAGVDACFFVDVVQRSVFEDPIDKPGGMREEMPHGDRLSGGLRRDCRPFLRHEDAALLEGRQVVVKWVVELKQALLIELHDCNGGHDFRHGKDAEDGVILHRHAAGDVARAVGRQVADAAPASDREHASWQCRVLAQEAVEAHEAIRTKPNSGRRRAHLSLPALDAHPARRGKPSCNTQRLQQLAGGRLMAKSQA
mmetsp:Transcript_79460/g.199724  ORF Transcript_79460/g.199724 Transcript_79460/m.199724 type:complete len:217 (+) Transcript_79460:725-1375(+)